MTGSGLYVALRGDASAQGDGTLLWRTDDGRRYALLTPDELDLLDHCGTCDTLAAHAAGAATALGIGVDAARAGLERLAVRGLLTAIDDTLARAPARAAPAMRPRVVVRVLGTGDRLTALLATLANTPPGAGPPTVDVLLPDGLAATDMPSIAGLNARFHDATSRRHRWQALAQRLDPQARARIAPLLGIDGLGDWQRASWNWALLLGRGSALAVLDDHDAWPPRLAPRIEPGLTLLAPGRQTAWAATSVEALDLGPAIDDALGLAVPYLGQPAATLAAAYPGTAGRARGAPRDAVLWPDDSARVRCIAFGEVADAARFATGAACADDAADVAAFLTAATLHGGAGGTGTVAAHTVRTGCLVRASALTPVFVDARTLLPPMPAAGGSRVWLALVGALDADAVTLELPVLRLRTGAPDMTTGDGNTLAMLVEAAGAGFASPRVAPAGLAARLADLATASDADLARTIAMRWHDIGVRRLAQIDAAAHAPSATPATRAALAAWREAAEQQLLRPCPAAQAMVARRALAELSMTLSAWAELWSAADAMEDRP